MGKGRNKSGTRKYGRNKIKCAQYKSEHRRERNKARILERITKLMAKKREQKEETA